MRIFLKDNTKEEQILHTFEKIKDHKYYYRNIFTEKDRKLINTMIDEIKENIKDKENTKFDPAVVKKHRYIDLLMRTKQWGAYKHFYSMEERQLLNDMIEEFQQHINSK